jgi:putative ABC transport system permease protein
MSSLWQDLRIAARSLAKNPGFVVAVVLALALGVGVNVGVFGIVNTLLFRSLPVAHPEELAVVFTQPVSEPRSWGALSYPDFLRLREERQLFSGVLATATDGWVFNDGQARGARTTEQPSSSRGEYLGSEAFPILGLRPALGRAFTPEEDRPGGEPVILLSHRLWRTRFHADPGVLGRKVYLNAQALTVIGVMPASFQGLQPQFFSKEGLAYWLPLGQRGARSGLLPDWSTDRSRRGLTVLARLRPGVTLAQAQARADLLATTLAREFPDTNAGLNLKVVRESEGHFGPYQGTVKLASAMALAVAGLVLVICCANVANLLLARTARRGRELGIRLALGSSRTRLIRLLLTESLVLALLGGALGLGLAFWFGDALVFFLPPLPAEATFSLDPDPRVVGWGLAAAVLAGLGFGILPAWRASRGSLMTVMKTDLRTEGHRLRRPGLRQLLVIAQLAISVVVVAAGGLFLRSLKRMETIDPGYRPDRLVSALVNPGLFTDDPAVVHPFFDQLTRRLEQLPGVASVSATLYMPLVNPGGSCGPIIKEGDPQPPPNQGKPAVYSVTSARYFETMGTPLLRGRDFTADERRDPPGTVIVNATLARRLFGSEDAALGRRLRISSLASAPLRIVGVARDGHYQFLLEDPQDALYLPGFPPELHDELWSMKTIIVRGAEGSSLTALAEGLRAEVHRLDARIPLELPRIGDGHLLSSMLQIRMAVGLGLILGSLALALASMGIYSVMTYTVGQRTREIGIRMALGGQVRDVLALVVGQGLALVAVGVAAGCIGAWLVSRLLGVLLYGVTAGDPLTYLATVAVIVLVALLATLLPARRAALVDPTVALRAD